ncbi:flagellar basal body-associated FliL family protein [Clostridium uliginosum]|uniref:Flagellar protein FliL n=1 Tax=Clostridium uliginosum TaxID=119641 RepID=A0A1I1KLG7_9CLOT|nr:flagellar basal body-associated FliL family protein [Clostridium uliginosum]SFC61425.1 flagellar FliL protein [Clostridium uliginosum]
MADKEKEKEVKVKSGGMKKVLLIIVLLLIVGGGTFGATYYMFMQKGGAEANAKPVIKEVVPDPVYVDLGEVTVNLADEGGKRFFKGQISVGYDATSKDAAEELVKKKVAVRDATLFYLKSLKVDFINNPNNEKEMKKQLAEKINAQLVKSKIIDVRFDSILTQ